MENNGGDIYVFSSSSSNTQCVTCKKILIKCFYAEIVDRRTIVIYGNSCFIVQWASKRESQL